MKRKQIRIISLKSVNCISKLEDIKVGDIIEHIGDREEVTEVPYGKIACIGCDSFVISWFRKQEHIEDYNELQIIYECNLGNPSNLYTFVDKKIVMAWLI